MPGLLGPGMTPFLLAWEGLRQGSCPIPGRIQADLALRGPIYADCGRRGVRDPSCGTGRGLVALSWTGALVVRLWRTSGWLRWASRAGAQWVRPFDRPWPGNPPLGTLPAGMAWYGRCRGDSSGLGG